MEYIRYIRNLVISSLFVLISYVLFNYYVDSMNVFHLRTDPFESYADVNERFMKSLYLENNCAGIQTMIFGDSRTAGYVTDDISKRFENSLSYNYSVQSETLVGIHQKVKWLAGKGCRPENIIVPLSIDRIELYDYTDDTRLLMQENPALLEKENFHFDNWTRQWHIFKKYLFSSSIFIKNIKYLNNHFSHREPHLKFSPSTGDTYYYFDHPCEKIQSDFGTIKLNHGQIDAFVNKLKLLYDYANKFGSEIVLLWNPQLYDVQMSYELESTVSLLKKIEKISPYIYRIPLDDGRLKDTNYYHDCSHFKKMLGKSVLDKENKISTLELIKEFQNEHSKILRQRHEN